MVDVAPLFQGGANGVVAAAAAVLAALFVVAGLTKLADRAGTRRAFAEFGVPDAVASASVWLIACGELGVAVALLGGPSPSAAALAALALIGAFSTVIAGALVRGRAVACHCFGMLSAGAVSWATLARNAVLASLALLVALHGRASVFLIGLGCVAAALWLAPTVRQRWRRHAGRRAPSLELPDADGRSWTLESLAAPTQRLLLVFSSPGCWPCNALLGQLARWEQDLDGRLTIALVSAGARADVLEKTGPHELRHVLVDEHASSFRAFGVAATPSAVLLDRGHTLEQAPAEGADEIAALVAAETSRDAAPVFERRRLLGRTVLVFTGLAAMPVLAACGNDSNSSSSSASTTTATNGAKPSGPAGQIEADGAYLCNQAFALCTGSPCVESKDDPTIADCRCSVEHGYSVGYKPCAERRPSGQTLISTFSTLKVTEQTRAITCPSGIKWANCVDVECTVDPNNPGEAVCKCILVSKDASVTFLDTCDTSECKSTIWSGASQPFGNSQYVEPMRRIGQKPKLPQSCPTKS